jgi:hypothetical protein
VPPSPMGFPSSQVTLTPTAAPAAAGAIAAAAMAVDAASRALQLLRLDLKLPPCPLMC